MGAGLRRVPVLVAAVGAAVEVTLLVRLLRTVPVTVRPLTPEARDVHVHV
jgi:hypothetical protein